MTNSTGNFSGGSGLKIKSKDKGFNDMMSGAYGMPHPANMFGFLGENASPAWFMR